jgi:hypothetical protein
MSLDKVSEHASPTPVMSVAGNCSLRLVSFYDRHQAQLAFKQQGEPWPRLDSIAKVLV